MNYLIDTHAHLDMYEDWGAVIENAKNNGIKKIIIPESNNVEEEFKGIEIIKVKRIIDAISACLTQEKGN